MNVPAIITEKIDFKFDVSFKYSRQVDYTPTTLNNHMDLYTFMKKISIHSDMRKHLDDLVFDIKPVYYFQNKKNNTITGFITNTGSYINIIPQKKSDRLTKIIDNNYYTVDKSIIEYQKAFFTEIYDEPISFSKLMNELESINSDTVSELFTFNDIYINNSNKVLGITTTNGIYIPLKREDISKYNDTISTNNIQIKQNIQFTIVGNKQAIEEYIDMSKTMFKILDYTVPFFVKGFLLDDSNKLFNKIILNTGDTIDLSPYLSFLANTKSQNQDYKINNLLNKIFIEKANEKISGNSLLSKKDKLISKFSYTTNIYIATKYCIFKLLQKTQFRILRNFIKKLVYSIEINSFIKKISLIPIVEILFNILVSEDNTVPDIYPNISIDNVGNLDKCNGKYIVNTSNAELISRISKISNIQDYLKLSIQLIFGNINSGNIEKIKLMFNLDFDGDDIDALVSNTILKMSEYDINFLENISITNYNKLIDLIPVKSCKLQMYTVGNNIKINKIKLIDELIQNNYSKIQILDNFKILSNTERYRYNDNLEIFLSNKDLNSKNRIAELYKSIKKLYYRNILDFDETDFITNYEILSKESVKKTLTDRCHIVNDGVKEVKIIHSKPKELKNNSKFLLSNCSKNMEISRCKTLSNKDIFKIYKMNTIVDKCVSEHSEMISIKFVKKSDGTNKEKKLIYTSR